MVTPSKLTPIGRFVACFGMIPSSYKEAMTYEEQLVWLCHYLETEILPAINNNADGLIELQQLYVQLKDYVDNYFDNLDIQQEVSDKIDAMVESGQLQEIITAYLQVKGVLGFDTVADMKAGTNFIDGSIARTLGRLLYNDGEGAFYKIRDLKNTDVIDEINIIAITDYPDLVAELIKPISDEKIKSLEDTRAKIYDTFADAAADANIANVPYIQTKGFYEVGDNGAGLYEITNTAINSISIEIATGVYATLIIQGEELNIKQLGAYTDDSHDDTEIMQTAIDFIKNNYTPYIQAGSQLVLNGNYKASKITGTLYIPFNLRIKGFYLNLYAGTYEKDYTIFYNIAPNTETWEVHHPRENVGWLKDFRIFNKTNEELNGIWNASNNTFTNVSTDKLAISFKTIGEYLDTVNLDRWHVTNHLDVEDYAIHMGYLGDTTKIINSSIDGYTEGHTNNNAVELGAAHNGIIVENTIIHGNLHMGQSNVTIINTHFELGHIETNGTALKLTNGFLYHEPPTINLTNRSVATLENVRFIYRYKYYSYAGVDDIDVQLDTSSSAIIKNCYKFIIGDSTSANTRANIVVQSGSNKLITNAMLQQLEVIDNKVNSNYPFPGSYTAGIKDTGNTFVTWQINDGTYYYKAVKMVDFTRNLGYATYNQEFNVTLTQGEGGVRSTTVYKGSKWRVYRGTSADTYDKVVEYSHAIGDVLDNGNMLNGYKWNDRTAGAADVINSISNNTLTKYDENDNIVCHMAATPTSGTWKVDDIVITPTKVYRCSTSNNTGGVWTEI